MRKTALVLASTALAVLVVCGVAWADTFAVKNTKDTGAGSLRQAIIDANARPGSDVITFAPGVRGEIRLWSALPTLAGQLEVRGPGASKLTVRRAADRAFRIFTVAEGSSVRIAGLTVSNGLAESGKRSCTRADDGGGVLNESRLTLKRVVISANRAGCRGGGVFNADNSTLTVEDSTFLANINSGIDNNGGTLTVRRTAFSENRGFTFFYLGGGGILNSGRATVTDSTFSGNIAYVGGGISSLKRTSSSREVPHLTVTDSTFSGNRADGIGGGISSEGELDVAGSTFSGNDANRAGGLANRWGTLTVAGTTFSENTANERGGGIYVSSVGSGSPTIVRDSTFSANRAGQEGGGIYSFQNEVGIVNSTFSRNRASHGGGVFNTSPGRLRGYVFVEHSTFANNEATVAGGGLYNFWPDEDDPWAYARIFLEATIVARNEAPEGPDVSGEAFTSSGHNLVGDPAGFEGSRATDLTGTAAGLDSRGLRDNGGPTKTFALTANSPAVDAVGRDSCTLTEDQRGVSRPQDGDGEGGALCDIGAYERQAPS